MTEPPDFDPFELLGVDRTADALIIDRAYKARIRFVHPDIAGPGGLEESKRLNLAREWLLDPDLRSRLPRSWGTWVTRRPTPPAPPTPAKPRPADARDAARPRGARPAWDYDPLEDDPLAFDFGSRTVEVRAFFEHIRALASDERARVSYSLGDEAPVLADELRGHVQEPLQGRSRALADAVERVWRERADQSPPLLFPRGRVFGYGAVAAGAFAQWLLLGDAVRQGTQDEELVARLAWRSTWPWEASIGQERYGARQAEVLAFLEAAGRLTLLEAERLARAWQRHMGTFLYGRPGEDWFPGDFDTPRPALVSARLAAVDASRIEPPEGLAYEHHNGFRYGLRLTAHVVALGGSAWPGRDYLRPWREALDASPSFWDRARFGMPVG